MATKALRPTEILPRKGWYRSALPADLVQECSAVSDDPRGTGYCVRPARWSKPGHGVWCAAHAMQSQKQQDEIRHASKGA